MDAELAYLIDKGEGWIREQRRLHRPRAGALHPRTQAALAPFFGTEVLRDVRVRSVPVIENPDFYDEMAAAGRPPPMDFAAAQGITFDDTVLLSTRGGIEHGPPSSLLFHELVHVVQYRLLGVAAFMHRYVTGWAAEGFVYEAIPLERDAFELQHRFEQAPRTPFCVRDLVSARLGQGRVSN